MDLSIEVVHARDFVRVTPSGDLDFKNMSQMLLAAISITPLSEDYDILIDCRQAITHMTLADVTKVVETMTDSRHLFRGKLAILPPDGQGYKAIKFMEIYASNRGVRVAVFEQYEQAMDWLMPATTIPPPAHQP